MEKNEIETSLIFQSLLQNNFEHNQIYSSTKNTPLIDMNMNIMIPLQLEINKELVQQLEESETNKKLPYDILFFKRRNINEIQIDAYESRTIKKISRTKNTLKYSQIIIGHYKDNQYIQLNIDKDIHKVLIGRNNQNHIVLDNQQISSTHAYIQKENESYILYDNNSQNGSYVKIQEEHVLVNNCLIELGNSLIKIGFLKDNSFYKILVEKKEGIFMKNINKTSLCYQLKQGQSIQFGRKTQKNVQQQFNNVDVNYILIEDNILSSQHCTISYAFDGELKIVDNNSSNGTWLKVVMPYELKVNDIFRLSNIEKGESFKILNLQ